MARHSSRSQKWFAGAVVVFGVLVATAFLAVSWSIESGINDATELALIERPGDRVSALMAYAESPAHSFRERNRAVWALGRVRDRRALPLLEKHYHGEPCDHEHGLCQRELRKAIDQIRAAD